MEYVKVQIKEENIELVKEISSFAKVINYLLDELKNDIQKQDLLKKIL